MSVPQGPAAVGPLGAPMQPPAPTSLHPAMAMRRPGADPLARFTPNESEHVRASALTLADSATEMLMCALSKLSIAKQKEAEPPPQVAAHISDTSIFFQHNARCHGGAAVAPSGSRPQHQHQHQQLQQLQQLQPQQPVQQFGKKPHRTLGQQVQTLAATRLMLSEQDPDCLFVVRHIQNLGFGASRKLKAHFKNYGPVVRVWISQTVGQHGELHSSQVRRRRPCNLGFLHMETSAAVLRVLAEGEEQQVDGFLIQVQRFQRQIGDSMIQFQLSEVDEETEFKDQVDGNMPDSESTEKVDRRRNAKIELYQHIGSCAVLIDSDINGLMQGVECKTPDSEVTEKADYKTPDSDSTGQVDWKRPESGASEKAESKTPDSEATEKDCNECCQQHFSSLARRVHPQAMQRFHAKQLCNASMPSGTRAWEVDYAK